MWLLLYMIHRTSPSTMVLGRSVGPMIISHRTRYSDSEEMRYDLHTKRNNRKNNINEKENRENICLFPHFICLWLRMCIKYDLWSVVSHQLDYNVHFLFLSFRSKSFHAWIQMRNVFMLIPGDACFRLLLVRA